MFHFALGIFQSINIYFHVIFGYYLFFGMENDVLLVTDL